MDLVRGDLGSSLSPTPTNITHDAATPRTLDNKWEVKVAVKYEGWDGWANVACWLTKTLVHCFRMIESTRRHNRVTDWSISWSLTLTSTVAYILICNIQQVTAVRISQSWECSALPCCMKMTFYVASFWETYAAWFPSVLLCLIATLFIVSRWNTTTMCRCQDINKVYLPLASLSWCQFCHKKTKDDLKLCSACGEVSSFHGSTFLGISTFGSSLAILLFCSVSKSGLEEAT